MKITGWRIDGFGLLADLESGEIGPGLTVIHGPNEAGKSTLVAFIRGVLFGFPDRRHKEATHDPLRGGRHGGLIRLADEHGLDWTIERHAGRREPVITGPGGESRTEQDIRRLLGGASAAMFKSVFAFSLPELRDLDALDDSAVRDLLFSAGVVGAGQTATRALRTLDERRAEIARPRKQRATANALLSELDGVEARLRNLREAARHHPEQVRMVDALAARVESLRRSRDELRERASELGLLISVWPLLVEAAAVRSELVDLERQTGGASQLDRGRPSLLRHDEDEALRTIAPGLVILRADLSGYLARRERLDELEGRSRLPLEASIEEGLRTLGPKWDLARVDRTDASAPVVDEARSFGSRLAEQTRLVRDRRGELETAEQAEMDALAVAGGDVPGRSHIRSASEIDGDRAALRAARTLLGELARAVEREENVARELRLIRHSAAPVAHPRSARPALGRLRLALFPLALALMAVASWAALRDRPSLALACGVGVAALAVAYGAAVSIVVRDAAPARESGPVGQSGRSGETDPSGPSGEWDQSGEPGRSGQSVAAVESRLAGVSSALGLGARPDLAELDRLEVTLDSEERRRAAAEAHEARVLQARATRSTAARRLGSAVDELAALGGEWEAWINAHGLDGPLTPEGAVRLLELVRRVADRQAALQRVCDEIVKVGAVVDDYERRAWALLEKAGMPASPSACGTALAERLDVLEGAVRAAAGRLERAEHLRRRLAGIDDQLRARLGTGERAGARRSLLESTNLEELQASAEALARELAAAEESFEAAVRAHQDASRRLDETARSDEIAVLDQTAERLRTELSAAIGEWWSLSIARSLVDATLEQYERERQPAVVRRASELFASVTGDAYRGLVTRGPAGPRGAGHDRAVEVLDSAGRRFEATALSAGTIEQLYLCLRLALAETFAERSVALPFVMDDVLVNFDPSRARAVAEAIASAAERNQVLLLTCHPHIVGMMREVCPGAGELVLPRYGGAM